MLGKSTVVSEKPNQDLIDVVIESFKTSPDESKKRPNSTLIENYDTEITSRNRVSTSSDLFVERRRDIKEETKTVEARRSQFLRQRSHRKSWKTAIWKTFFHINLKKYAKKFSKKYIKRTSKFQFVDFLIHNFCSNIAGYV